MSKHRSFEKQAKPRRKDPHPVWRGIGCLSMLIIPAISFGISTILVQMAPSMGVYLPPELLGRPVMPELLFKVPGLIGLLNWIQRQNNLYAILIITFAVVVVLAGIIAVGYALAYRIMGPPRYTGYDAPPPRIKVKKYKR
ncbi:MAG: hypothetical protein HY867_19640 [Chloroflexi bacterium]|nr:hypothetical protein [Chloroflexota bacterium]